ncbi:MULTISPECIES: exodeoxyribonuclease VII small subunit [Gordonia]|uniref:exodeoxyribonuclease VII small subunit n=1 Tax=unclassified Gordonia (in: high G+C Gram-positive bacteria) TaxID=2657482 RepID=UPI0007EB2BB8|nr:MULTISPECIES: exodeoxyribonuclease VII small subunit [unclassified Gordonia (in: high G+C Gram-positive bacteria)]OBC14109.1 exodeoxyribonuclease VII small subunit [Gordonia sp. 852002-50816_SCH5313054-a]OBC18641.1 exodeoxyribonuclease VII small subunit [Gordonia sp. 852002-50816_SCH5313054-c]
MTGPAKGKSAKPIPVAQLGYEQARDELIEVVTTLEHGGLDLDASLALWERGEALATRCEEHLTGARDRIEAALSPDDSEDEDEFDDSDPDED